MTCRHFNHCIQRSGKSFNCQGDGSGCLAYDAIEKLENTGKPPILTVTI